MADHLVKTPSGQWVDADGRKLIAQGYCQEIDTLDFTLVMKPWNEKDYGPEEVWTIEENRTPAGMQKGSYMVLFEDGDLDVWAEVWTAEEIAEIKARAKEFDEFFDLKES